MSSIFSSNPNYQNLYVVLPLAVIWVLILFFKKRQFLDFLSRASRLFIQLFKFNVLSILFLLVLSIYGITLPLSYDEAYTFTQFVDRSMFYAVATYPVPNNHVLHSVLSNISWFLFSWTESAVFVRLPAILASGLMINLFYQTSKSYAFTCLLLVFLLFNFPYFSFAFQARGYSIQTLMAVATAIILFHERDRYSVDQRDQLALLFTAIGLYTSPAYLYAICPIYAGFLIVERSYFSRNYIQLIKRLAFLALTVILLYSPIAVFRGYESITNNQYVQSQESILLIDYTIHWLQSMVVSLGGWISASIIALGYIYFVRKRNQYYLLTLIAVPLIMMVVLKQLPFSRVFLPVTVSILVLVLLELAKQWNFKIASKKIALNILTVAAIAISTYFFHGSENGGLKTAYDVKQIISIDREQIYMHQSTHDHIKVAVEAELKLSNQSYLEITDTTQVKDNDLILYSEKFRTDVHAIDSIHIYNKKVYLAIPSR